MNNMKILAITQARYGSTRLPAKILKEVNGITLLETHLHRLQKSKLITKLMIATTDEDGAQYIIDVANKCGVDYCQGSVNDVLDRFYQTAKPENPDYIVRITSDCPLIDPAIIDKTIKACLDGNYDYATTSVIPSYPDGMDCEVFKYSVFEKAWIEAFKRSDREHVTPYIWRNSTIKGGTMFKGFVVKSDKDLSSYRITVDTPKDFEVIKTLIQQCGTDKTCDEYVNFLDHNENIKGINAEYERNEGYVKSLREDEK